MLAQEIAAVVPEAVSKDAEAFARRLPKTWAAARTYQDWVSKGHAALLPFPS